MGNYPQQHGFPDILPIFSFALEDETEPGVMIVSGSISWGEFGTSYFRMHSENDGSQFSGEFWQSQAAMVLPDIPAGNLLIRRPQA